MTDGGQPARQRRLMLVGTWAAVSAWLVTGAGLVVRYDAETGARYLDWPRDVLFQVHTALAGVLLAAAVAWVLPVDWHRARTPAERIAANICLTAMWCILIYALARH